MKEYNHPADTLAFDQKTSGMINDKNFDVLIIGGSYAGLSAAMALGRSLRSVLIIDSGKPCNRQTPHSHNFLTQDGARPEDIAALATSQVLAYKTVSLLKGTATGAVKTESGFTVTVDNGENYTGKKLIIATGIKDEMPSIEGFADCWGISVIHCPYCHGYEFRDQKTAIMASPEKAFHLASLVRNLSGDVTIIAAPGAEFTEEQLAKLGKHNVTILNKNINRINHDKGYMTELIFDDGSKQNFTALYAGLHFTQHSGIPVSLGCELTEHGHIKIDHLQKTTVPGVYACGDNSAMLRAVASAVYSGNLAGAMVNKELTDDTF